MEPAVIVPALGLVDTAVRAGGDEAEDVVLGDDGAVGGVAPRAVGAHGIMVGGAGPIVDHRIRQMGLLARRVMSSAKAGEGIAAASMRREDAAGLHLELITKNGSSGPKANRRRSELELSYAPCIVLAAGTHLRQHPPTDFPTLAHSSCAQYALIWVYISFSNLLCLNG